MRRFGVLAVLLLWGCAMATGTDGGLRAGEGTADITPPIGTELAGFHKPPGQERRSKGVRQPSSVRVLILSAADQEFALVSLDLCGVSQGFCRDVKAEVARRASVPAENIHLCATHTHSMPTLRFFRQWGGMPGDYAALVSRRIVDAAVLARRDVGPARLRLGKERVVAGNFNRTSKTWKTDDHFGKGSTEQDRWLDTMLHALVFEREGRPPLVWYQFSEQQAGSHVQYRIARPRVICRPRRGTP